jgi:hypothetical protein
MDNEIVRTVNEGETTNNNLIVIINGQERGFNYETFGLTFESTDNEIISAISGAVRESFGMDISNYYKVQKVLNTRNIYIIPNSVAGK